MRIQPDELVALGHGIWVRSDEVVAIEPIREDRGPGRRSRVWVRGLPDPFVASRSEEAVLRDLTHPRETLARTRKLETAVERVAESIERVPPVLLRVVAQETGMDLRSVVSDAREVLVDGNGDGRRGGRKRRANAKQPALPEA